MSDQLRLTKSEILPQAEAHHASLAEEAWQSFKSQPTSHIVAEVAVGTLAVAFAARGLMTRGARAAATAEELGGGRTLGDVLKCGETSAATMTTTHMDAGMFPANARDLRAALESFGGKAASNVPDLTIAEAKIPPAQVSHLTLPPENKFNNIEEALSKIRKSGFPRLH